MRAKILLMLLAGLALPGCPLSKVKKKCEKIHGDYYSCISSIKLIIQSKIPDREKNLRVKNGTAECRAGFESSLAEMMRNLPEGVKEPEGLQEKYSRITDRLPIALNTCEDKPSRLEQAKCGEREVKRISEDVLCPHFSK